MAVDARLGRDVTDAKVVVPCLKNQMTIVWMKKKIHEKWTRNITGHKENTKMCEEPAFKKLNDRKPKKTGNVNRKYLKIKYNQTAMKESGI